MPKKLTQNEKLLIAIYEQLQKETGDVPTVAEVQERYREKYGNSR